MRGSCLLLFVCDREEEEETLLQLLPLLLLLLLLLQILLVNHYYYLEYFYDLHGKRVSSSLAVTERQGRRHHCNNYYNYLLQILQILQILLPNHCYHLHYYYDSHCKRISSRRLLLLGCEGLARGSGRRCRASEIAHEANCSKGGGLVQERRRRKAGPPGDYLQ